VDLYFGKALRKGNNRLQFAPDGSLWIGQTDHGWVGDQGIQRISWNGKVPMEILSMNLTSQGFDLTFTHPVDKSVAAMAQNYQFKRYYYTYHKEYGSKQMDMQPVKVTDVQISADGKKVSLRLAEMKPGYVYEMQVQGIRSQSQLGLLNNTVYYTLNALKK
jgi:hypothetical protein